MAKVSQVKYRRKNLNPVFHQQTKEEDDQKLSAALIKNTRKSGQLNLSNRSLQTLPERLWTMYEPLAEEINYNICKSEEEPWWNYRPLHTLDLSSNCLIKIPSKIEMFQDLTTLNLQDNNLTELPNELGDLTKLTKFYLNHNHLVEIPKCIYRLTELKILLLAHNKIETVDRDISDLVMLEKLDLSHNAIKNLPPDLGYLVRLTEANFSYNQLIEFPSEIDGLRALIKLDLTQNELTLLPSMCGMRKLQFLYATHNNIEEMPNFEGCEYLEEVHFGNNYVKELSKDFFNNLPHIKLLDLRDNKLKDLPDDISPSLIRLDLTNNSLTDLPNTLATLPHLQNLKIDGNLIRSIRRDIIQGGTTRIIKLLQERLKTEIEQDENATASLSKKTHPDHKFPDRYAMRNARALNITMQNLSELPLEVFEEATNADITGVDFCKNKLQVVPSGLQLLSDKISEVNLSFNLITYVPEFLAEFNKLQYLNLASNLLTDLPLYFGELKYLRELVISNNRFPCIPECVYNMEGLEILLIRDNKISEIDVNNLARINRLATLDLSNNNIDTLPPELGNFTRIRCLEITGNSFRHPRQAIIAKGTDAILAYLRDRIPQ